MKKITLIPLFLMLFTYVSMQGQTTAIPDPNFEQALIDLGIDDDPIINGVVFTSNISVIDKLDVSNKNISDLTGLEDFIALTSLNCNENMINSLDVASNVNLMFLFCNNNQLSQLDVTSNLNLRWLYCERNELVSLDISLNTKLDALFCSWNKLSSLNLSSNLELLQLYCQWNQLTSLNVNLNTRLHQLWFGGNQLKSIDVSQNLLLAELDFSGNQIGSLDVGLNPDLELLWCQGNYLKELDLSSNSFLWQFRCEDNQLTYLDLRNGNNTEIWHYNSKNNPELTCIYVDDASFSAANWTDIDANSTFVNNEEECSTLSIEDFNSLNSKVYYSSSIKTITISSPLNITAVRVYSLSGQELQSFNSNPKTIQVNNLSTGIYIIQIDSEKGREVKKIIKH
ncbi:T9SS type A sorting domain-containing protein [Formosa sp. PL04]|uniref:T9SS type A sorting domain-containing protein n=1 Tax=Formosa sp. PL04 TaxID=3081755 RepID=UPI0029812A75|nr:T9SS type A sorting domain-containing protein [Formosa sp. PL04]MDW5289454.1 T9SS type A sorting domain-containing protein [Formosa sp. PL04]